MQSSRYTSVRSLLDPASIAVVGASDNPERIGGRPLRILAERGFTGPVYPVNPKYRTVQGATAYPDIASLPDGVEMYVIAVAAQAAVDALEQAAERGAKAAVVFAGGFAETGEEGARLQRRMRDIARDAGMALVGPNSLGVASFANRAYGTFATTLATMPPIEAGSIALVSQSGGTAFNLLTEAYWTGARFSHIIATGNEAGTTFPDYLRYLATDDATSAVIGYMEGIADGSEMAEALAALQDAGKPVFMLKVGASERGSRSVASHTAQFSGDDSAFDALFDRFGVVRIDTMDDVVDVARALTLNTPAEGIAVATNSGGSAVYQSDMCERHGVLLADLPEETTKALAERLPSFAGLVNPVDFTPQVLTDHELLGDTVRILDASEAVDTLLVFLGSMGDISPQLTSILARTSKELRKPLVLSWLGVSDRVRVAAAEAGLVVAADPARVLRGLGLARKGRRTITEAPGFGPPPEQVDAAALEIPAGAGLGEETTMALLDQLGLPTPRRASVTSRDEAVSAAEQVGYPCVLKLVEPFMAHRAKVGAVVTGLADQAQLEAAYDKMVSEFGMTRALVVEQVPPGAELIVGVLSDRTFGTRAVIGAGGVWANEVDDARTLVPPFGAAYVEHELRRLKLAARLAETADLRTVAVATAKVLTALDAAIRRGGIREIECNPVRVGPDGFVVLDALAFGEDKA